MSGNTESKRGGRRIAAGVVAGVALLLGALYVAGYYLTGDRVPAGTTVSGIDVGGLYKTAAAAKLQDGLDEPANMPLTLIAKDRTLDLVPEQAGLSVDIEETVRKAGAGRSWNPIRMIDILTGSDEDIEPVVSVDDEALTAEVAALAVELDKEPAEPAVTFNRKGRVQVVRPEVGSKLDQAAASDAIRDAYLKTSDQPVQLPVTELKPKIDDTELDAVLRDVARPAVSAPVQLKLPGHTARLLVRDYARALTLTPKGDTMVLGLDETKFVSALARVIDRVGAEPKDATVALQGGQPVVVPAEPGVTLDAQKVAEAVLPVLTKSGAARSATVGATVVQAEFTTRDAEALKITEMVSEFTTYFPYAEYRNVNQGRAAQLINGTVVKPGETFSFNETVGERTRANGFTKGFIISNGVFAEDLGGGVSQVVTTTYNTSFFAGMTDIEHTPHSFYIDRYPLGREATVAWPSVDLKFRNDTPYGVLIEAWVVPSTPSSSGEMHVRMWSTKYWDIEAGVSDRRNFTSPDTRYDPTNTCVATTGYGGFDVDVYRTFRRVGSSELDHKETQHVRYIPADTVICTAPPR